MSLLRWVVPVALLGACGTSDEEVTVTLQPYLVPCIGVGQASCMVGMTAAGDRETFYGGIEGFTFVWGETHRVTYRTEDIAEPPADGSSLRFIRTADTLVDTAAASDEFDLAFGDDSAPWFTAVTSDRVQFAANAIDCATSLCTDLMATTGEYTVRFRHGATAGAVATAISIVP